MFIPTDKTDKVDDSAERPIWPSCSRATRAGRRSRWAKSFDVSTAATSTRGRQRTELGEGIKVALLPKKTRGEEVSCSCSSTTASLDS